MVIELLTDPVPGVTTSSYMRTQDGVEVGFLGGNTIATVNGAVPAGGNDMGSDQERLPEIGEGRVGQYVIAVYRAKEGKETDLLGCVRNHVPVLRAEGLVTDREPLVLRAPDGAIVEIFEWESAEAVARAHHNDAVKALWARFDACCTFGTLATLPGADGPFPHFELVQPELPLA